MKQTYYLIHGYGGENSLMPLADYLKAKGEQVLVIDDQKFPYERREMFARLAKIREEYRIALISSAHIWFDEVNYMHYYGRDPQMISVLELLDFLKPEVSAYYPHDMESFFHDNELIALDRFDLVMLPYVSNLYYRLRHSCRRVMVTGWIKKHTATELKVDAAAPEYHAALFPSNIISFYNELGPEGYADWFCKYIGKDIPIKMPAGDAGVVPILTGKGYSFLDPSRSVYDVMNEYNIIIGSGHSSIIFESALSGIPTISLLDGVFPDETYLQSYSGIKGVYPMHPEELTPFLEELNRSHRLLEAGPNLLQPFDFEGVYQFLSGC